MSNKSLLAQHKIDTTHKMVKNVFDTLQEELHLYGPETADDILVSFLASVVSTLVFTSLQAPADADDNPEKALQIVRGQLEHAKTLIQMSITGGFEAAFKSMNPNTTPEYECDIICVDNGIDTGVNN